MCDGLIHCARRKANTADPAEVTLEFLLLTHTGHVPIILAPPVTIFVADGHVGGVCGLFFVKFAPSRHRELVSQSMRTKRKSMFRYKTYVASSRQETKTSYGTSIQMVVVTDDARDRRVEKGTTQLKTKRE